MGKVELKIHLVNHISFRVIIFDNWRIFSRQPPLRRIARSGAESNENSPQCLIVSLRMFH